MEIEPFLPFSWFANSGGYVLDQKKEDYVYPSFYFYFVLKYYLLNVYDVARAVLVILGPWAEVQHGASKILPPSLGTNKEWSLSHAR